MPVGSLGGGVGDGYGYDLAINPARNAILTSSFTGWNNYMRDLGEVVGDPAAMKKFGNTMAMWDLKAMQAAPRLRGTRRAARDPLVAARR